MKRLLMIPCLAITIAACSSTTTGEESCPVTGTYSDVATKTSGNCPELGTNTVTITADGPDWFVEYQGLAGGCNATNVPGQCKIQGKCDLLVLDPTDPTKNKGTLQFSLAFDRAGFKGSSSLFLPAAKASPAGCSGDYADNASRK